MTFFTVKPADGWKVTREREGDWRTLVMQDAGDSYSGVISVRAKSHRWSKAPSVTTA